MRIYDISKMINAKLKVWPGDQEFERSEAEFELPGMIGHASSIRASLHTGTHVDAHWHYNKNGISIEKHELENYVGSCQVIDVTSSTNSLIALSDISVAVTEKRILLKTANCVDETEWNNDFKGISPELVHEFHKNGVILIGIDTPSVDLFNTETLTTHQAFYDCNMYNLEGVVLNDVKAGIYQLVALPLRIEGADGSPVRAILIKEDE
jgi:arylformamidase